LSSTGYLLDVNFLVALAWPNHLSHAQAKAWFLRDRTVPFATCPITEAGFVRISMNPLVVTEQVSLEAALRLLGLYQTRYAHVFWNDDLPLGQALGAFAHLTGHRQITDAYLLALAASKGGALVTFDQTLATQAPEQFRDRVVLVDGAP